MGMELTDWLSVYAATLSTITALWNVVVYRRDRHKVAIQARYIPSVGSYVIEVVNSGRRPITVAGVGINTISDPPRSISPTQIWTADAGIPLRLDEGGCGYFQVPADGANLG